MQNFFINKNQIKNDTIIITGKDVNHIKNVLRCKIGEKLEIGVNSSNTENKYIAKINKIEDEKITCKIVETLQVNKEANIHINIIQGLPKADKMELIIQKCTELGVKEITPLELNRCIVKISEKDKNKKINRWQTIAEVAAKQCGRNLIPKVNNIYNLKNIYTLLKNYDIILLANEIERDTTLKSALKQDLTNKKIAVIIGPEGGFEPNEIENLKQLGARSITLGRRILRTETVAMIMTGIILYENDNL
ncbi:MAG: 16S rRNA (uracil(1498)-N(3))-methyltransferase [Oscillospiraceae bacterium]|nr:16S rRNA (uracil(1498)-N(3))-methyltransferase [Oscillospiraceae bacterium]